MSAHNLLFFFDQKQERFLLKTNNQSVTKKITPLVNQQSTKAPIDMPKLQRLLKKTIHKYHPRY